jgi:hypothetical protein
MSGKTIPVFQQTSNLRKNTIRAFKPRTSRTQSVLLFRSFTRRPSYRWTHRFVCSMNAPNPAAWPPHATFHFRERFFDTNSARFGLFAGNNPTDPFVTRERCDVLPQCECFRRRGNSLPKIFRKLMYSSARKSTFTHTFHLIKWPLSCRDALMILPYVRMTPLFHPTNCRYALSRAVDSLTPR